MRKENIGKFMSVKDLTTYEVLKDEDLKGQRISRQRIHL